MGSQESLIDTRQYRLVVYKLGSVLTNLRESYKLASRLTSLVDEVDCFLNATFEVEPLRTLNLQIQSGIVAGRN